MSTAARWILGYGALALAALLAGPLTEMLPFLSPTDSDGPYSIRFLFESAGALLWWTYALAACWNLPDHRPGLRFFQKILVPLTSVLALILSDQALRDDAPLLMNRIGPQSYAVGFTALLVSAAAWFTAAWWLHRDTLRRVFAHPHTASRAHTLAHVTRTVSQADTADYHHDDTPSASSTAAQTDGPPETLGRYKVLKELGRGAMGVVYLGKDPTIQRFVAIKAMHLDTIEDAARAREEKARFFREAESTGRLSHPNIVTIYDAGEDQGLVFLAMEMLEGTTLKHWARKPNLMPMAQLIPTFAAVADALDYAHQQGVVHRDIKPANIMVTQQHGVKVMDFGVAKMASSSKTHPHIVLGTPTYMSPEQLSGRKVDGRSDIFSLGVVLYELLLGRPPFTAENVPALLYAIAHTPHAPLATLRPGLPAALIDVVDCALQKDAAQRYRRAGEMAHALRACLHRQAA